MRLFLWHVHGSWTTALVAGRHEYLIATLPDRGADGRGRAQTWEWPAQAIEVSPEEARAASVDAVILQRPHELNELARWWLGREPGRDVPAIYVEHNAPQGAINAMRHSAADRPDVTIVHVTHFNRLFWDCGTTPVRVIEHGIADPGYRYTGELVRGVAVINEARRRARVTGTDLLDTLRAGYPLDLYGIDSEALGGFGNLVQSELYRTLPRYRAYVHGVRWTSLGLSLIEAMHLGMPVVAVAATEVPHAVPQSAGFVSTDAGVLADGVRALMADAALARRMGKNARRWALRRYSLTRFLRDWDLLLEGVCHESRHGLGTREPARVAGGR